MTIPILQTMQLMFRDVELTCPRAQRMQEAEPGFKPKQQSDSRTLTLNFCCYQKQASFERAHPKCPRLVNFNS